MTYREKIDAEYYDDLMNFGYGGFYAYDDGDWITPHDAAKEKSRLVFWEDLEQEYGTENHPNRELLRKTADELNTNEDGCVDGIDYVYVRLLELLKPATR